MDKIFYNFLEFEKEEKVFERKYKSVYYWQSIRLDVARKIIYRNSNQSNDNVECKNKKGFLSNFFSTLFKESQSNFFISDELVLKIFDIIFK